jgi:hypothetical protein
MGTQNEMVLPRLIRWARQAVQETFILPCLLWSAQYKIFFFLSVHYFNLCVPIAQQPKQAVEQGRLFCVRLPTSLFISKETPTAEQR